MASSWKRKLFIVAMLAYPVLHFLVFNVFVNLQTFAYSVQRWSMLDGSVRWVMLENYVDIIKYIRTDHVYKSAVINTLLWIPLNVLVMLPLSLCVAYWLSRKIRFHNFYRIVYFFPSIISIVVITMVFSFAVSPTTGIVNNVLGALGLEQWQLAWLGDPRTALGTVFFFCVWAGIGLYAAILLGAITRISSDLFEVARLEGMSRWRELRSIIIPLVWPTISTLIVIGTSAAFTIFLQPKLLTKGGPNFSTNTVTLQIVTLVQKGDYGLASAFGVLLLLVGLSITVLIKFLIDRKETYEY